MQISSSFMTHMSAGRGLDSVENRVRMLEAKIRAMEGTPAQPSFKAMLQDQSVNTRVNNRLEEALDTLPTFSSDGITQPVSVKLSTHAAPIGSMEKRKATYTPLIQELSEKHGVDPNLILSVVQQESGFNPKVVSSAGAQGMMQLMPQTAQSLGVTNPMDPIQNLDGGIRYLKTQLDRFNGNIPLALAAYNAGPGAVQKHDGVPPYRETQNYVRNILAMYLKTRNGQA